MNFLKVIGGIGLVVLGGAILLFKGNNDEEQERDENSQKSIDDIISEKYEKFSETDENPYNVKGCVVPEELIKKNKREDYETPVWVKKGRVCADASANLGRAFFDIISMGYDYYGQYMNCTDPGDYYYNPRNNNNQGYSEYRQGNYRIINYGHNQIII